MDPIEYIGVSQDTGHPSGSFSFWPSPFDPFRAPILSRPEAEAYLKLSVDEVNRRRLYRNTTRVFLFDSK
jgi:hypothetical protein